MVESAAHLADNVVPESPVRQWVLTFPFPLRFLLAAEPQALTAVLAVVLQCRRRVRSSRLMIVTLHWLNLWLMMVPRRWRVLCLGLMG